MPQNPASRFLSESPPRRIDVFTKLTVLFGGMLQQMGWAFLAMGSLFSWIFLPASDVALWFQAKKEWIAIPGQVISSESTNSSVNDQMVYLHRHDFELNGQTYEGQSYSIGKSYHSGDQVIILYEDGKPENSHIEGERRSMFPALVLFVLIFPLIGLGFVISHLKKNAKAIRLLEHGTFTRGALHSKEGTNSTVKINGRSHPIFKYRFEFTAGGKTHFANCKTYQSWLVEDEEREIILYDPFGPEDHVVYDSIANMPRISPQGMLEPATLIKASALILPAISLLINWYFIHHGSPLMP